MTVPAPRGGLRLLDVTLTLGDGDTAVPALDRFGLNVAPGEFVAVVGPPGSGKSSLLAVAGGIQRPTSGTVHIAGTESTALPDKERTAARRRTGFVFQQSNLPASLTAREQLPLPPAHRRTPRRRSPDPGRRTHRGGRALAPRRFPAAPALRL